MGVKSILFILIVAALILSTILLISISCTDETEEEPPMPVVYIVGGPQVKTFVVGEEDTSSWIEESRAKRYELNKIRSLREDEDNQEEFEIKSKLSNVRRIVDHEIIVGYDEDLDDLRWKTVE